MSLLLNVLLSHILSMLEKELAAAEPEIAAMIIKEMSVLSNDLENLVIKHMPKVASAINPVVDIATKVVDAGVLAAGAVLTQPA